MAHKVLSMILAGGQGSRLMPLTDFRAKPAVPFGGHYRIIDFVMSNFVNSDLHQIYLLTQCKSFSLQKHLHRCWRIAGLHNKFIDILPAQIRTEDNHWYQGTADAIYQNLYHIREIDPDHVCVFGGDHIYTMDIRQMIDFHIANNADLTVSAIPVIKKDAHRFGIIKVDSHKKMIGFEEKPSKNPFPIPDNPEYSLASMGNYIFKKKYLIDVLLRDHHQINSSHDFGKDIISPYFSESNVMVYDFTTNYISGDLNDGYWRDVGTVDSYWQSNMDLLSPTPPINLKNPNWPIQTYIPPFPPALINDDKKNNKEGYVDTSMIGVGCTVHGVSIEKSILGYNVNIGEHSFIKNSIILPNVNIGEGAVIKNSIIDKYTNIESGIHIGVNHESDKEKFFITKKNIVVVPRRTHVK